MPNICDVASCKQFRDSGPGSSFRIVNRLLWVGRFRRKRRLSDAQTASIRMGAVGPKQAIRNVKAKRIPELSELRMIQSDMLIFPLFAPFGTREGNRMPASPFFSRSSGRFLNS